ncbi:MAG: hypothetical protein ACRDYD_02420, partial [Acidimicrobiales bacterium]
ATVVLVLGLLAPIALHAAPASASVTAAPAPSWSTPGYWMTSSDGATYGMGNVADHGSAGLTSLARPVVGMASTPDGGGYWLVASDGGIFSFGDARFRGSMGGSWLDAPVVGLAAGPGVGEGATVDPGPGPSTYPRGSIGYDISWPQCGSPYPGRPYTVAVVGVNDGSAFTVNPCLDGQAAWGGSELQLYLSLDSPLGGGGRDGPAGHCSAGSSRCLGYNYGYGSVQQSWSITVAGQIHAATWWLDIEPVGACGSYWSCDQPANTATIQGAVDALRSHGVQPGIYSTAYQWGVITGGASISGAPVLDWVAGASSLNPWRWCGSAYGFGGGRIVMVQETGSVPYDDDYAC